MGVQIKTVDGQKFQLIGGNFPDFKRKFISSLGNPASYIAGDQYVINAQHVVSVTEIDD